MRVCLYVIGDTCSGVCDWCHLQCCLLVLQLVHLAAASVHLTALPTRWHVTRQVVWLDTCILLPTQHASVSMTFIAFYIVWVPLTSYSCCNPVGGTTHSCLVVPYMNCPDCLIVIPLLNIMQPSNLGCCSPFCAASVCLRHCHPAKGELAAPCPFLVTAFDFQN